MPGAGVSRRLGAARASQRQVAALFVRSDSIYKRLAAVDAWDAERDARRWPGGRPLVAHPPCAQWSRLRHFARLDPDERALAPLAVELARKFGGVVEHPAASRLWQECGLPKPGEDPDRCGGWSLAVSQFWWGHRAEKRTWLYIVGCAPRDVPPFQLALGDAPAVVEGGKGRQLRRPVITKAERTRTPPAFAEWLCELARRCQVER